MQQVAATHVLAQELSVVSTDVVRESGPDGFTNAGEAEKISEEVPVVYESCGVGLESPPEGHILVCGSRPEGSGGSEAAAGVYLEFALECYMRVRESRPQGGEEA